MIALCEDPKRQAILNSKKNLLIMGGPGSGKTTIALFKAKQIVDSGILKDSQKVLFLSFARATISRIEEQAGNLISPHTKGQIEINTYHGFIWNIIRHHGYLLTDQPIKLLPPHEAPKYILGIEKNNVKDKFNNLFYENGLIHFDLFAQVCTQLLTQSCAIRRLVSRMYPIIILDEFQDTNQDEWNLIKLLGEGSRLIVLADPNQRIYDFRGADPQRIIQLIDAFSPDIFDFGEENNRSDGTDIAQFGNDLLSNSNQGKQYQNVDIKTYAFRKKPNTHLALKFSVLQAIERLKQRQIPDWSIAVLVPTNALMLEVSDFLQRKQILTNGRIYPPINHEVAIETAGPSLAGLFIAFLLDKGSVQQCTLEEILKMIVEYILGRRGNNPVPKKDLEFVAGIEKYFSTKKVRGKSREGLLNECRDISAIVNQTLFSGNIIQDWKSILGIISQCHSDYLLCIANDAKYIRLLQRGTQLYSSLDGIWRRFHTYEGAFNAVSDALTQEHFAMSTKRWSGVNVMTIHKAKGKEFDEVIIYEGLYHNRIVSKPDRVDQARLNLRVAVTRAKKHTLILTPVEAPCPLL